MKLREKCLLLGGGILAVCAKLIAPAIEKAPLAFKESGAYKSILSKSTGESKVVISEAESALKNKKYDYNFNAFQPAARTVNAVVNRNTQQPNPIKLDDNKDNQKTDGKIDFGAHLVRH